MGTPKNPPTIMRCKRLPVLLLFVWVLFTANARAATDTTANIVVKNSWPASVGIGLGVDNILNVEIDSASKLPSNYHDIELLLNGQRLRGLQPQLIHKNGRRILRFHLEYTDSAKAAWRVLFSELKNDSFQVSLELGLKGKPGVILNPVQQGKNLHTIRIARYSLFCIGIYVVCMLIIFVGLGWLAAKTPMLHDAAPAAPEPVNPVPPNPVPPNPALPNPVPVDTAQNLSRPYSLALTQMAVWFVAILASFLFIFLSTGKFKGVLTPQSLILMGIAATTTVAARGVEFLRGTVMPASGGFWSDLFTDVDGVSLHRVQMAVWTVVLVAIYLRCVITDVKIPEFDATELLVMGISAGVYLGFKVPERHV